MNHKSLKYISWDIRELNYDLPRPRENKIKDLKKGNLQTRNIKTISTDKESLKQKKGSTQIHKNIQVLKTDVPNVVAAHI